MGSVQTRLHSRPALSKGGPGLPSTAPLILIAPRRTPNVRIPSFTVRVPGLLAGPSLPDHVKHFRLRLDRT